MTAMGPKRSVSFFAQDERWLVEESKAMHMTVSDVVRSSVRTARLCQTAGPASVLAIAISRLELQAAAATDPVVAGTLRGLVAGIQRLMPAAEQADEGGH